MVFIAILILITLSIASSAAFFSVYGLAQIFSGAFIPVIVMASSLEAGKLIAASYVYRFWNIINIPMKTYLISAILVLMMITSAGIFGFLSSAYQQDILPIKLQKQKIALLTSEKTELEQLKHERLTRKRQIDSDITSLPKNFVTGRQRLMESYNGELSQLRSDIASYTTQIQDKTLQISKLKNETLKSEAHVGPIIFIAEAFGKTVDDATKWLILLIIFAFDPLAVSLTIGVNIAMAQRKKEKLLVVNDESDYEPEPQIISVSQLEDDADNSYHLFPEHDIEETIYVEDVPEEIEDPQPLAGLDNNVPVEDNQAPIYADEPLVPRRQPMSQQVYKPHNYRG